MINIASVESGSVVDVAFDESIFSGRGIELSGGLSAFARDRNNDIGILRKNLVGRQQDCGRNLTELNSAETGLEEKIKKLEDELKSIEAEKESKELELENRGNGLIGNIVNFFSGLEKEIDELKGKINEKSKDLESAKSELTTVSGKILAEQSEYDKIVEVRKEINDEVKSLNELGKFIGNLNSDSVPNDDAFKAQQKAIEKEVSILKSEMLSLEKTKQKVVDLKNQYDVNATRIKQIEQMPASDAVTFQDEMLASQSENTEIDNLINLIKKEVGVSSDIHGIAAEIDNKIKAREKEISDLQKLSKEIAAKGAEHAEKIEEEKVGPLFTAVKSIFDCFIKFFESTKFKFLRPIATVFKKLRDATMDYAVKYPVMSTIFLITGTAFLITAFCLICAKTMLGALVLAGITTVVTALIEKIAKNVAETIAADRKAMEEKEILDENALAQSG